MSEIWVAKRKERKGLYLGDQNLMFYLPKTSSAQLDELIRKQLEKLGIRKESEVQKVLEKAEQDYELRVKVQEAIKELKRLMDLKRNGNKLMSRGFRKWTSAFYRPMKET
jgi:hypothetical protein